jgi:putative sterol carrier protein
MAGDVTAILQISASGNGGGDWIIEIKDKKCTVEKGITKSPDLSLSAATDVINDVFTGELDAMRAFMQGKIQFKGNMGLAMKITKLFSMDKNLFRTNI